MQHPGDLRLKLVWLTVFRTVATTLLLATTAARLLSQPLSAELSREDSLSFIIIAFVYLATVLHGLVLRSKQVGPAAAYAQVFGDIVLASCLVFLTGAAESPFTFAYSIAVVAASILLFQRGALIAAAASSLAFLLLVLAVQNGMLRPANGAALLTQNRVIFVVVSNTLAQFLIAALASYLSRQLRATGGRLSAREAELADMSRLQRQILACMPSGLITCEQGGAVTFVNHAGAAILGLGESRPSSVNEILPGVLSVKVASRRNELTVDTPMGRKTLGLTVTPMDSQEGSLLVVFQDLTDLRRIENEMRRIDHLAALGTLAAQLAHEIRNPLASMRGSAQLLETDGKADPALTRILVREADRLSSLVEDFLRFARPPPPAFREASLAQLVRETFDLVRADPLSTGIDLQHVLDDFSSRFDPDQLKQVLINMLRNALVAVGKGGRVVVRVARAQSAALLSVWDSGGGIPQEDLGRIFDPFFTTREGGTGLGLSTSHSIVRAHSGTIHVTSTPQSGTEFVVTLPGEEDLADSGR